VRGPIETLLVPSCGPRAQEPYLAGTSHPFAMRSNLRHNRCNYCIDRLKDGIDGIGKRHAGTRHTGRIALRTRASQDLRSPVRAVGARILFPRTGSSHGVKHEQSAAGALGAPECRRGRAAQPGESGLLPGESQSSVLLGAEGAARQDCRNSTAASSFSPAAGRPHRLCVHLRVVRGRNANGNQRYRPHDCRIRLFR
jgi:hypothetical protein